MKKTLPQIIALGAYDASLIYKNTTHTHPRRVRMYEIEAIQEDGGITHIDDTSYPIRAGNVIIAKPGQMRHTTLPFKCLYLHLMVEDEELIRFLDSMPDLYTPSSSELKEALGLLISAYTSPDTDGGMHVAAALCQLLSRLIRDTRLTVNTSRKHKENTDTIERAIAYMNANYCRDVTLEEIAEQVYLSRSYFHKLFVAATGRTPYRYLLERRLSHAQKLLMTTELSAGAIARECGFSSQSYFNQVFFRELGCTPMGYKKQMSMEY